MGLLQIAIVLSPFHVQEINIRTSKHMQRIIRIPKFIIQIYVVEMQNTSYRHVITRKSHDERESCECCVVPKAV